MFYSGFALFMLLMLCSPVLGSMRSGGEPTIECLYTFLFLVALSYFFGVWMMHRLVKKIRAIAKMLTALAEGKSIEWPISYSPSVEEAERTLCELKGELPRLCLVSSRTLTEVSEIVLGLKAKEEAEKKERKEALEREERLALEEYRRVVKEAEECRARYIHELLTEAIRKGAKVYVGSCGPATK